MPRTRLVSLPYLWMPWLKLLCLKGIGLSLSTSNCNKMNRGTALLDLEICRLPTDAIWVTRSDLGKCHSSRDSSMAGVGKVSNSVEISA